VGGVQDPAAGLADGVGAAVVDICRGVQSDPGPSAWTRHRIEVTRISHVFVCLGGGGSLLDERQVVEPALKRTSRALYWPFALPSTMVAGAIDWLNGQLGTLGADLDVTVWRDLAGHDPSELGDFDLLLVGGGNTFSLLDAVRRYRFHEAVRDFVAAGGMYYGGSAGAILATDNIAIAEDPNEVGLRELSGLGLLRGWHFLPHYGPQRSTYARRFARDNGPVLGVPETSGVLCREPGCVVAGPSPITMVGAGGPDIVLQPGAALPAL
jgi:dipeptidase E